MHFRALLLLVVSPLCAAPLTINPPAEPVTLARIATLPAADQPAWKDYLSRSEKLMATDKAAFAAELKEAKLDRPIVPPGGRGPALNQPAAWFATEEATKLADNVVSFQTLAGGWGKNLSFAAHPRAKGELFGPANLAPATATKAPADGVDLDAPHDAAWHYFGTFDNNATTTQLQYLAKVISALDEKKSAPYRASFQRGLEYTLTAQYPNGGWPQIFPLEGGYHDAITYNDGAMCNILEFLRDVADGKGEYAFVAPEDRKRAAAAEQRGIACIVKCQIVVDGKLTAWCQQHDALTLAATSARNYEMPSICGSESGGLVLFLMQLPSPSPGVVKAVHAACAWFEKTKIEGKIFKPAPDKSGRAVQDSPGATPLWARYYEIETNRPIFGDRDKSIHYDVSEISKERRNGYSWYGDTPKRALEHYTKWAKAHPSA